MSGCSFFRARETTTLRSSESYVLARGVNDVNVKFRAGLLEVKLLTARTGPLEGWLPVTAACSRHRSPRDFGVDMSLESDLELSEPAILLIAEECRDLNTVRVSGPAVPSSRH